VFHSEGGSVDGARTNKFQLKFHSGNSMFWNLYARNKLADSNSYFGRRERSKRYCKWPHRGVALHLIVSLY